MTSSLFQELLMHRWPHGPTSLFGNNYWENQTPYPHGQSIPVTHNVYEIFPSDGGYPKFSVLQRLPLRCSPLVPGNNRYLLRAQMTAHTRSRSDWYFVGQGPRDSVGYSYTSVGGGAQPPDGISSYLGGPPGRAPISDLSQAVWPNVVRFNDVLGEPSGNCRGGRFP